MVELRPINPGELPLCLTIRHQVFVVEQNVPAEIEVDGLDPECWQYIGLENERAIATARVLPSQKGHKIQRVAVLATHRGNGIGRKLMRQIEQDCRNFGVKRLWLGAQIHAAPFYQSLGYLPFGAHYQEAGIEHVNMELRLI